MTSTYRFAEPPPFPHQMRVLQRIIETKGVCALLCDPGTGKTRSVLDYAAMLATKTDAEVRVLIIPPLAAIDGWVEQAMQYIPTNVSVWAEAVGGSIVKRSEALASRGPSTDARNQGFRRSQVLAIRRSDGTPGDPLSGPEGMGGGASVVLLSTNLDGFASRAKATKGGTVTVADRMVAAVAKFKPDLLVIDESHRIKGSTSNTSKTIARLRQHAPRRLILTGTVMPHSPLDAFGQWRFLDPSAFGTMQADGTVKPWSFSRFRDRYARMGGYMGRQVMGFQNLDELEQRMARNSVVVKKVDALDLPPWQDARLLVRLSTKERKAYDSMRDTLVAKMEDGRLSSAPNKLAQMMRLRQLTSGILATEDGHQIIGDAKARTIVDHVTTTLAGERRVIVFAHFVKEVEQLAERLAEAEPDTLVEVITGGIEAVERTAIRKRFGGTAPGQQHEGRMVIVAQMRTLSLAVNELVTASHAVFGSLSERRDDYVQARDRLDRIGQTLPVTFWHALVPGTVDEVMLQSHRDGTSLEDALLRHLTGEGVQQAAPGVAA